MASTCELLEDLMQIDYDAVRAYEQALEHVDDEEARGDLEQVKIEHQRHLTELAALVRQLGGHPGEIHRDATGLLLEGMTLVRSVTGTLGALRALRTDEKVLVERYEKALDGCPDPVLAAVARHWHDECRHLALLDRHIARCEDDRDDDTVQAVRNEHPNVRM